MAHGRRMSKGPDAASAGWLLGEVALSGAVLGLASWLVSAALRGGLSPEPGLILLVVGAVTALVGAVFALGATCAGLAVLLAVDPRRTRPRLRLVMGAITGGVVTGLLARMLMVPQLLLPVWLPVAAGITGVGFALLLLLRYERRRGDRRLVRAGSWPAPSDDRA